MPVVTRRARELIASLDEVVVQAQEARDSLSVKLREAQYRYECLEDARARVAQILAELDKPEEPPF